MGYFDDNPDMIAPRATAESIRAERELFAEERGTTTDIIHDLWAGSGDAITLLGDALGSETLKGAGSYIGGTEFAKEDTSQFYGTQGRIGRVVDGIARSLPTSLAIGGTAAMGGVLGGVPGAAIGFTSAMGALGKGTFEQAMEEVRTERPELSADEQFKYGMTVALSEVGSEGLGWLLPFGIGKMLSKPAQNALVGSLLDSGRITTQEAIGSIVKNVGGKEVVKSLFGGAVADGASEVVNELVQAGARDTAGLDEQPVDLIDIFLIGSAPGAAIATGTLALGSKAQVETRKSLETALQSEDLQTRVDAVDTIRMGLNNISPEVAEAFHGSVLDQAISGPVNLEAITKFRKDPIESVLSEVTKNPEAVLEEAGIPVGGALAELRTTDRREELKAQEVPEVATEPYKPQETPRVITEGIAKEEQQRLEVAQEANRLRVDDYMAVADKEILEETSWYKDSIEGLALDDPNVELPDASVPLYDAIILDNSRSQAIKQGMENVLIDTNTLAGLTDLNEREVVQKRIEKTQKQILKEVDNHVKETKVIPKETKVVPKETKIVPKEIIPRDLPEPKVAKAVRETKPKAAGIKRTKPKVVQPIKPEVKAEKPLVTEEVREVPKPKKYAEALLVTEKLEEDLATAQVKAKSGKPEVAAEAADRAKVLAKQARESRKHLQTLEKPKEEKVYANKKLEAKAKALESEELMDPETVEKVLAVEGTVTPEIRVLAREHVGTTEEFLEDVKTHRKEIKEGIVVKSDEGKGEGRTITYYDGTTLSYDPKAASEKRWIVRKGGVSKATSSLTKAKKAVEGRAIDTLPDSEAKGGTKKTLKEMPKLTADQKKAVAMFLKTAGIEKYGESKSNVLMAATSLASQEKLYVNGKLNKEGLKTETASWEYAEESSATESKAASTAGIKSGATEQIELSTEAEVVIPKKAPPKEKPEVAEVKTVDVDKELKAKYLAEHKARMEKRKGMRQEDYIGKYSRPLEAAATKLLKSDVVDEKMTDVLTDDVQVLRDEALYADPTVLRWRKNREQELSDEFIDGIYEEYVDAYDGNAYLGYGEYLKNHPLPPKSQEEFDTHMVLRSEIFHNGEVMQEFFKENYKDAAGLLDAVIEKGTKEEVALAKMIKGSPKIKKLAEIPLRTTGGSSYFTNHEGGKIYISSHAMLQPSIWLHEIQHAVTSEEITANKEIREEVEVMMRNLKNASGLSAKQIEALDFAKGDSVTFNESAREFSEWTSDELEIAYALVNEREFLAQAYSSKHVRDVMRATRYTGGTQKTSIWQRIKDMFAKIMQLPKEYDSVLEAALRSSYQLYNVDAKTGSPLRDSSLDYTNTDRRKETLDEATRRFLKENPKATKLEAGREKAQETGKQALSTFKKLAEPISDTLSRLSPAIHGKLMQMESRMMLKGTEYANGVKPFLQYYKGLTESQKARLNIGLMNSNKEVWEEMPKGVRKSLETVLQDGAKRSMAVGYLTEERENYFPRRVKDINGLADYLTKDQDEKGPLGIALKKKADDLGMKVSELPVSERNQVVSEMLASGEILQLPKPGSAKDRSITKVTSDIAPFYENSADAIMAHIYELNDKVSLKEFVGGSTRKAKVKDLMKLNKKIEESKGDERDALMSQWEAQARELQDLEGELDQGLQALIDKELSTADPAVQTEVLSLLSARMRQKGASGIGDTLRNVGYAATLGNFLSAITQFGDIPIIFYRYGINKESLEAIGLAFKNVSLIAKRELTGKGKETDAFVEAMDFTNALREFATGSNWSSKSLDTILKYSGLKYTDLVGKEAALQASMKFYQKPKNKQKFLDKYEHFFPDPEAVLQKIQMGNKKDADVLTALFAELSDFQPVSLSQQSEVYLKSGNARMFYALKSFTLRTTSAAIREGMADFRKGGKENIAKGAMKFSAIIALYAAAGAGADELKDLLRGRTSSLKDNTIDNVMQMFFLSSYDIKQGMQKDALLKGLMSQIIPPVRHFDNLIADVTGLVSEDKEFKGKSLSFVPVVGSLFQARSAPQQESYKATERTDIMEDIKKNKEKKRGARYGGIADRILAYNKSVSRDLKITNSDVMKAYRK